MESLSGRTAVVTGAGSGMGRAFAERFAAAGMNVVLADVELPKLDEAVAAITATGAAAIGVPTDVTDGAAVDALRDAAIERFGNVHVLCNNAGVGGSGPSGGAFVNEPEWRWVLEVNLFGVIHGHRAFLPHMTGHGEGGHVVNTASMAGHFPGHSAYSASKWAVVAITEGLYHDQRLRAANVGVSCLCPGWVNTAIMDSARNRPEWAAPKLGVEPNEIEVMVEAYVRDQIRSGMDPANVADLVHDAIVSNTFWVFTDRDMVASLEPRYRAILDGTNPPEREFGI
ncbi:MAG: SDR family NAD(P)-dependent oxidoreductase [Acidimicrobiales bacterium]|nr:SDR family NAD(P)-dependent oxidoreductase [Acidimicrobiales bacterium]MCB9393587.1 SDR family NAD(P)-dependent oxidoreductase [Acidimicrobiaceae bacterium]